MTLFDLQQGQKGIITKVKGRGTFRKRIKEMGFVKGKEITVIKSAPLHDPIEYRILDYDVSLRRSEARLVEVITLEEAKNIHTKTTFNGVTSDDILKTSAKKKGNIIDVALVGNPNSGKTSLFNYASHSKEHVGNYSGVTVDLKSARFQQREYTFNIVDLPGTYSLSAYTPEELYVRKYIFGSFPDIVINVVDASNLERNLYLTTQLIDMDIRVVIALNMFDELTKKGDKFDYKSLGEMIGIPIIPTVSSKGTGLKELFDKVIEVYEDRDPIVRHIHINYGKDVEKSIYKIQDEIWINKALTDRVSSRFYSIKLLEKDKAAEFSLSKLENFPLIKEIAEIEINKLENQFKEDSESIITDAKYGFISGALRETFQANRLSRKNKTDTEIIDTFITHKVFGFPIFLFFLWLMFQTTFSVGSYPMNWINSLIGMLSSGVQQILPNGMLKDLLIDGIIGGVGGVIVFLPNIIILFFFISLMEDTGYMARAAFIMDKLMHKIGLHGKAFIPLIMGFGCNVPAIMATRTLENKNDRLLTMLINPFMSCSARLPVYILITGAFFPKYAGTVLFSIYLIGILLAILVAILFKKTLFKSSEAPFVMELPPYRIPSFKSTTRHMWFKSSQYLRKMGGIILAASIIIWALEYFPRNNESDRKYESMISKINENFHEIKKRNIHSEPINISLLEKQKDKQISKLLLQQKSKRQKNSYIGQIGHFIEPAIAPLGFDWKMGVSILSGIAAKEIIVSTMGVLYQTSTESLVESESLSEKLKTQKHETGKLNGKKVFTPLNAFSFLIFILIYFPCIAVFATISKESGSWKWAVFVSIYTTSLAYIMALLTFQIGSLF